MNYTDDQLEAIADTFDTVGYLVCGSDLVFTTETVADFIAKWGTPAEKEGFYMWTDIQTRKGATRGDLVVTEFDGQTVTYFTGQA